MDVLKDPCFLITVILCTLMICGAITTLNTITISLVHRKVDPQEE